MGQPVFRSDQDRWELSIFVGSSQLSDGSFAAPIEGTADAVLVDFGFESSYILGARVTENLGQYVGGELSYSFSNQPLVLRHISPNVPLLEVDHNIHQISYGGVFYPLRRNNRIYPFGSAGAGASFFQIPSDSENRAPQSSVNLKDHWKFAAHFGGGVKIKITDKWGIHIDFQDQITGVPDYGLPPEAPVTQGTARLVLLPDGMLHNWHIAAGFLYTFSGR